MNFSITTESDTSLMLSWSEPVNTDGKIDYYIVSIYVCTTYFCYVHHTYYITNITLVACMQIYYSDGKTPKTVDVYDFTGSYVLEDLTPSTQYNIYVRAVRLIGENNEILEGYGSIVANATTFGKECVFNYKIITHHP